MQKRGNVLVLALGLTALISLGLAGFFFLQNKELTKKVPLTYDECLKVPGAVEFQSYPGICRTPDGRQVTQPISDEEKSKLKAEVEAGTITSWKTYSLDNLVFKYPHSFSVESNAANTALLQSGGKKTLMTIDSRLSSVNQNYEAAVNETRSTSDNLKETVLPGGIKFEGSFSTSVEKKVPMIKVILKYQSGAIYAVSTNNTLSNTLFDQILSTFKFLDLSTNSNCRPRPACLDAKPRCLIPETEDMCPAAAK